MFEPILVGSLMGSIASLFVTAPIPQQIAIKVFPHLHDYAPEGLDTDPSQVTLMSPSACQIYDGSPDAAASLGTLQSSVSSLNLALTASNLPSPIWIRCAGDITIVRKGVKMKYPYGGPIYAHAVSTGPELIEVKSLNDYLKGVVPSEMPASWPNEALQAQAIAARTYAVFHMVLAQQTSPSVGARVLYDVDDTVQYQAYTGDLNRTKASDQAVDETGSELLTYHGQAIQAYFSADAGGYTEEADHVWPVTAPYCQSRPEPFLPPAGLDGGAWDPWTAEFPLQEVNERLQDDGLISGANPVTALSIPARDLDESGRARGVTVALEDGSTADLNGLSFEHALGLRSILLTALDLDPATKVLRIQGRGFGHGVGMSQLGARLAAMNGWDHLDILSFYYTGVQLCDLTSDGAIDCGLGFGFPRFVR